MAGRLIVTNTAAAQLRPRYDATNYADLTVGSTGDLTIAPSGGDTAVTGRLSVSSTSTFTGRSTHSAGWTVTSGICHLGSSANTKMTLGLTINQGSADDEILAFKSSEVAHGITALAETDTYGRFGKFGSTTGGLDIRAISSGTGALFLQSIHTTDASIKSTSATGVMYLDAYLKSGTGVTSNGANANLLMIRTGGNTKFIFDADGDAHADVSWSLF